MGNNLKSLNSSSPERTSNSTLDFKATDSTASCLFKYDASFNVGPYGIQGHQIQDATTSTNLTAGETKFLVAYVKHMKSTPEVDWDSIARELDYEKVDSAKKFFSKLKIKLKQGTGSNTGGGGGTLSSSVLQPTPKGSKKRAAGQAAEGSSPTKNSGGKMM
ncbi:uncharacterized protein LY89DRAFT_741357 [Mollisia scopiformis]|uniref:Uncharacterized protein n=1 Tax=Mollisia scopiformis TaxID=149040 RepID=A0A132B9I0_MOLSC|nr:uncharacterized protein LY89DRAFT_741357 [Mollisia scopiformis]KUJ09060.1 hypothetical protein LY89DRAFT_741357 [Mollisia scopiformis]